MSSLPVGRETGPGEGVPGYQRHRPERTLLYQLVAQYYPAFADLMAAQCRSLSDYVQREFEDYLKCGRLEHGFLRVRCTSCHQEQLVPSAASVGAFVRVVAPDGWPTSAGRYEVEQRRSSCRECGPAG